MAMGETSLPVPAVVGMQASQTCRPSSLSVPWTSWMDCPPGNSAAISLARSIELPPPMPTTASTLALRAKAIRRSKSLMAGSPAQSSQITVRDATGRNGCGEAFSGLADGRRRDNQCRTRAGSHQVWCHAQGYAGTKGQGADLMQEYGFGMHDIESPGARKVPTVLSAGAPSQGQCLYLPETEAAYARRG